MSDGPAIGTVVKGDPPQQMDPQGPSPFWKLPFANRASDLRARYEQQLRIARSPFQRLWLAALVVALLALPFNTSDRWLSVLNFAAIASIGSIGLNLLTGFTGQISLGHAFFIGLGAYTAGYLGGDLELPVLVWLPAAGVLGAVVGGAIGPFALRLKGLYLAIVTLGLVFLGHHLFLNLRDITGGPQGRAIPSPMIGDINLARFGTLTRDQSFYLFMLPLVGGMALFAKNVVRSRPGRAFQAVRDGELAASVIGVNLARYKVSAFAMSSFYASVAGALLGSYLRFAAPGQFNLLVSIEYVAMIIVGGIGTIFGSILGALFIVALPRLVEEASTWIPFLTMSAGTRAIVNQAAFGLLVVVFLVTEPLGLAGLWLRLKVYFKAWPFSY